MARFLLARSVAQGRGMVSDRAIVRELPVDLFEPHTQLFCSSTPFRRFCSRTQLDGTPRRRQPFFSSSSPPPPRRPTCTGRRARLAVARRWASSLARTRCYKSATRWTGRSSAARSAAASSRQRWQSLRRRPPLPSPATLTSPRASTPSRRAPTAAPTPYSTAAPTVAPTGAPTPAAVRLPSHQQGSGRPERRRILDLEGHRGRRRQAHVQLRQHRSHVPRRL